MLLIKFRDKFCCFHRIYILKLGIQHKHEEINWNSKLQCIKRAEVESLANFTRVAKFCNPCEFSQPANLPAILVDLLTSFLVSPHVVPM